MASIPTPSLNTSKIRCDTLPTPAEAKFSFWRYRLGIGHQLGDRIDRHVVGDHQHRGRGCDTGDADILRQRIERGCCLFVQRLADRESVLGEEERVAIGLG
jgi:hypothetical protein